MRQFDIVVTTFRQVQDFVALAMVQPFEVLVGNEKQQVSGKSFMGMFTLDHSRPLRVSVSCTAAEYDRLVQEEFLYGQLLGDDTVRFAFDLLPLHHIV